MGITTAVRSVEITPELRLGPGRPLLIIAGPCQLEAPDRVLRIAAGLKRACAAAGLSYVFKASFDKANRTSLGSTRGPGLDEGLALLDRVRTELGVPVTTDVHLPEQAAAVASVVDLLQVPAFLCRQTDLLLACAATGRPVNVKKGQFLAPPGMAHVADKLVQGGAPGVILTERGTTFGHGDLVVDMRGLPLMRELGWPVCFDATHSVQRPAGLGGTTGGDRRLVPFLARAAVAAGVDAVFLEVHDDPDHAPSDGPNMVRLDDAPALLAELAALDGLVRG
ncbi:MAG: 3-deoxy-8-phosphooctulonate synthase [Alphaproteobacteria bacterium]|nr:3-deoxy-8-phosphooctulonate synthase [Alphaproteobacteria bacterium]